MLKNKITRVSFSKRSQIGQNALIHSKVFKEAMNKLGETISDLDIELEKKITNYNFLR